MISSPYILNLYADMRVIVEKRGDDESPYEVWPQKYNTDLARWVDHKGPAVAKDVSRVKAMVMALEFSIKLIRNVHGLA
jgi:hypothetical protein